MDVSDLTEDQARRLLDVLVKQIDHGMYATKSILGIVILRHTVIKDSYQLAVAEFNQCNKMNVFCLRETSYKSTLDKLLKHKMALCPFTGYKTIYCPSSLEELLIMADMAY